MREHREGARGLRALSGDATYDEFCRRCFANDGPLDRSRIDACSGVIAANRKRSQVEQALFVRGVSWSEVGDNDQAMRDLNRAIALNPNVALYYLHRGRLHTGPDRHARQLSDYERAAELDPRDTAALKNAAAVWFTRNIWTRSIQCMDRAIEIDPADARAYYIRHQAYNRQGNLLRALQDLDRAIQLQPREVEFVHTRAFLLFKAKQFAKAIPDYAALIELAPEDEAAWRYIRGICRLRLGEEVIGRADIADAKAIEPGIAGAMAKEGFVP